MTDLPFETPVPAWLFAQLLEMHRAIRASVRREMEVDVGDRLLAIEAHRAGDDILKIDVPAEGLVLGAFDSSPEAVVVVAEGIGEIVLPRTSDHRIANWRLLVDPLDGSRELAVGKRSAWILTGVAPNLGADSTLSDISFALQTEVPPLAQGLSREVVAAKNAGSFERYYDLKTGSSSGWTRLNSSAAASIRYGFAGIADYFPGAHALTGEVADRFFELALGPIRSGEAQAYNDQLISTGGALYLLASGAYRFFADLRPDVAEMLPPNRRAGLCAHPYDLSCWLVASEAGAIVTDATGGQLSYPLDTQTCCSWIGFANGRILEEAEGPLRGALTTVRSSVRFQEE